MASPVKLTTNALLDALRAVVEPVRPAGDGWMRVGEVATGLGLERSATRARLAKLLETGKAEHLKHRGVSYYRMKAV